MYLHTPRAAVHGSDRRSRSQSRCCLLRRGPPIPARILTTTASDERFRSNLRTRACAICPCRVVALRCIMVLPRTPTRGESGRSQRVPGVCRVHRYGAAPFGNAGGLRHGLNDATAEATIEARLLSGWRSSPCQDSSRISQTGPVGVHVRGTFRDQPGSKPRANMRDAHHEGCRSARH